VPVFKQRADLLVWGVRAFLSLEAGVRRDSSELDFPAGEADLVRAVEEHAFEGMPQEARGSEKIACKAIPGSWEDLTPDQVRVVQSIAVTLFKKFYPV